MKNVALYLEKSPEPAVMKKKVKKQEYDPSVKVDD